MVRLLLLLSLVGVAAAFTAPRCSQSRVAVVRMGFLDNFRRKKEKSNDEVFKPKLGGRVDKAVKENAKPQTGPSFDEGSAKMVGFYALLGAAIVVGTQLSS